ncbi:flagellar export protein FliJ [Romboutsia sp.]|uniref:flagellar export protein FliJ n=1 Tax=Romboutsia sp. TaxID=1965302 RepID=UPI003F2ED40C
MEKFKLQKLLDIRIKNEEESKVFFVQAKNKKRKVEENLKTLEVNYEKYCDISQVEDVITQKITINYLSSLTQSIKSTNAQLKKEEIKVSEAKEDLLGKQIQRKSLEILKENVLQRVKKEEERIEQITNDEFALYSFIRNKVNLS